MKKPLILIVLFCFSVYAFSQDSYIMYETMYIKPKADKMKEFMEALAAHNKQFHAEGASGNIIRFVSIGEHAGEYVWAMGPLTFTDLDSRPADDTHDEDWNKVMPYIDEISEVELWRQDPELSYSPEGFSGSDKIHIRAWDVKPGSGEAFKEVLKQIVEVFREKQYKYSWHVYYNMFDTGNGRDVAGVYGFNKWAEYDEESTWNADFNSVHGEDAWQKAMEKMGSMSTMTEEIRELVPELGGKTQ